jgi:transcriptional regulator GlxA family with amidase domain
MATAGGRTSEAAALWEHVATDCGAAVARGVAEVWVANKSVEKGSKKRTGI